MASLSKIYSAQITGLEAHIITIEVDIFRGFHAFSVVGLPDKSVEESRDRVSSAIKSTGLTSPKSRGQQKVVVSLAPANLKKEGPLFDVPISLAYLLATEDVAFDSREKLFLGELSLSGELRPVRGALLLARKAKKSGFKELYVPEQNAQEAALIEGIEVYGVRTLAELLKHLNTRKKDTGNSHIEKARTLARKKRTPLPRTTIPSAITLSDIKGQESAKRGLLIASSGGHNIAFYGPPGTGKTLLAKALLSILPPLSFEEALEVGGIHSAAGLLKGALLTSPPLRAPHHTSSHIAVVGGGSIPKPGEATLAHGGVLFLDEFPEFERRVIESLRQVLEDGVVSVARAQGTSVFPARFILVAAFNPCPCGFQGDARKECTCTSSQLLRYQRKISGPIIDRIDMWIEVPRIKPEKLGTVRQNEDRETTRAKEAVIKAREIQRKRFSNKKHFSVNARMDIRELEQFANLTPDVRAILNHAAENLDLSPRAYHRVIKLARTIADLDNEDNIKEKHILEALQYRPRSMSS